ncbi:MAG: polysaccharide deacetylase family protein [Bacteriovoracia bacterium]
MAFAAININFDSLGEMFGFPEGFRDPCFFQVADRFFKIADKYNFRYSIYVIGKDLENPINQEAVRSWQAKGHEIGSHSFSHRNDLGALSPREIREEVSRAHEILTKTLGQPVRGFIAPGWSASSELHSALLELDYEYDTSSFPSWLMFPALAKLSMNYRGDHRASRFWRRKDFHYHLAGSRKPYTSMGKLFGSLPTGKKELLILPLPTNHFRFACWHTIGFMFGWKFHKKLLQQCLKQNDLFYYLTHPADLLDRADIPEGLGSRFERMEMPLEEKIQRFEDCIEQIIRSGKKIVTMGQLADIARRRIYENRKIHVG